MNTWKMVAAAVAVTAFGTASQAATLTGDEVTLDVADIGFSETATVGSGADFTIGYLSVDLDGGVNGDELIITSSNDLPALGVTSFELTGLDFSGGELLTGAVNAFSQLSIVNFAYTGTSLFVEFLDGPITAGVVMSGTYTTAPAPVVPLPAGLPLIASGVALLGFMGRRKKA